MEQKRKGHSHRRNSAGVMCEVWSFTTTCSGCSCPVMERDKNGVDIGMGCEECGHTGKRRHVMYVPLTEIAALNNRPMV
jgi:hypothetical protein